MLTEFCVSGEYSEFTHINKVCNVPPQILGVLVQNGDNADRDYYSIADQGKYNDNPTTQTLPTDHLQQCG